VDKGLRSQRLAEGVPFTTIDALRIGAQVADAVARAHDRGETHGDLTLSSVRYDGGNVAVTDFGRHAATAPENDVLALARLVLAMLAGGDDPDAAAARLSAAAVPPGARALLLAALGPPSGRPTAAELRDGLAAGADVAARRAGEPSRLSTVFAELRRRRVIQTAFWYVGSSVAIVEAASIFLPSFGAPAGTTRLLSILAVFGLPIALTLAWTFDISAAAPRGGRPRRWPQIALLASITALSAVGAATVWRQGADAPTADAPRFANNPAHVAVLAFTSVSEDEDLVAFAGQLQSRLIDGLSSAGAGAPAGQRRLRVVSRATVLPFSSGAVPLDNIRALGVGTLLEGSIEPAAGAVRVRVRLVDAATGDQLDASVAEARADDRLALLDAVADSVIRLIRKQLGVMVHDRMRLLETSDRDAFDRVVWATRRLEDFEPAFRTGDFVQAARVLADAELLLAEAERFDRTWIEPIIVRGRQSRRRVRLALARGESDVTAIIEAGIRVAERALAVSPGDRRALELRGELRQFQLQVARPEDEADVARLMDAAERDLRASLVASPTPAKALRILSELASAAGRMEEALRYGNRAYEEDPYLEQVEFTVFRLFEYSFALGLDADAAKWCSEGSARFRLPVFQDCRLSLGAWSQSYPLTPDSAWLLVASQLANYPVPNRAVLAPRLRAMVAAVLARAGSRDSALAVLREARRSDQATPGMLRATAGVFGLLGMPDSAMAVVRALQEAGPAERRALMGAPELRPLHSDPRFRELAAAPGSRRR
jgi:TolB-like protein